MKLLLINSYLGGDAWHYPPLELGLLGTFVRDRSNCEVEIIDPLPQNMNMKRILKKAESSDIVGLNCFTERRVACFSLAKRIKEVNPDCKLVLGGPHATTLSEEILRHYPFVDVIVRGEGEECLLDIVKGKPFKKITGLTWKKGKKIIKNSPRPFIKNLDDVYIDYSLLPSMKNYIIDYAAPNVSKNVNYIYILASRGCPYSCKFCGGPRFWKHTWRAPGPEALVKRMEQLVEEYGVEYFRFGDGNFTANPDWVLKFCKELQKADLNVNFRLDARVNTSKHILQEMKKSGCVGITFGIESFSDGILRKINKFTTRKLIIKTLKISRELNLWTRGTFILLWPGETIENFIKNTLRLTKLVDDFESHILHILPGTELYNELKMRGEINDEVWFNPKTGRRLNYCKEFFPSANYSLEELEKLFWYSNNYHVLRRPDVAMKKYGFVRGSFLITASLINMMSAHMESIISIDKLLDFEKKHYKTFQKKMLKAFYD